MFNGIGHGCANPEGCIFCELKAKDRLNELPNYFEPISEFTINQLGDIILKKPVDDTYENERPNEDGKDGSGW
jgi:hypothetical protein